MSDWDQLLQESEDLAFKVRRQAIVMDTPMACGTTLACGCGTMLQHNRMDKCLHAGCRGLPAGGQGLAAGGGAVPEAANQGIPPGPGRGWPRCQPVAGAAGNQRPQATIHTT